MLKRHADQARFADRHGAIDLGMRLGEHYQAIVYEKGAMVLHMLRRTIGDEHFMAVLSRFCRENAGRLVNHGRLRDRGGGGHGAGEMDWFFDQWIRRTGYPVYRTYHATSGGSDGKESGSEESGGVRSGKSFTVRGQLLQEQEGDVFQAVVPLVFELENGERITREIWNTKKTADLRVHGAGRSEAHRHRAGSSPCISGTHSKNRRTGRPLFGPPRPLTKPPALAPATPARAWPPGRDALPACRDTARSDAGTRNRPR